MRHAVPTPQGEFSAEDFVVVETGFFGSRGEKTRLNIQDFSIRINGKKAVPSEPFGVVLSNLKDPNWQPPEPPKPKGGGLQTSGNGSNPGDPPPPPPKMPLPLVHVMQLKVEKASLPEGDRALPEAGLLFFPCRTLSDKIKSVELIYSGPAGKATLTLNP